MCRVIVFVFASLGLMSSAALADRLVSDPPQDLPTPSQCHTECRDDRRLCLDTCVTNAGMGLENPACRAALTACAATCDEEADDCVALCEE